MKKLSLRRRVPVGIGVFCLSLGAWARPLLIGLSDSYEPTFAAVVDLENRVIAQRDKVLKGLRYPFHFLRQSDLAWRVTDAETGRIIRAAELRG